MLSVKFSSFNKLAAITCCAAALTFAAAVNMPAGKVDLKSAGALAIRPRRHPLRRRFRRRRHRRPRRRRPHARRQSGASLEIKGINEKIAAMLGTAADQILIQDVVVNPISKNVYISVSRGTRRRRRPRDSARRPPAASSPRSRSTTSSISPSASRPARSRTAQRMETITQLKYVDGKVLVAGLSNEEFSSSLRSIPFPFQAAAKGAGIEIWHGSHGRFETNAPVRTFVPYEINGEKAILAAYTCTPLVSIPVSELKPGNKVKGTTIAELGNRNKPLDMIVYAKGGKHYILMANSSRGVMKLTGRQPGILSAHHQADRSHRRAVRDHRQPEGRAAPR